jgi:cytochrome c-type biogenesis protein CcmH
MAFWQILFLLGLFGALFVVWPLIKAPFAHRSWTRRVQRDDTQVELYQEHLEDLERAKSLGDIDEKQFDDLKLELQKNLLAEGRTEASDAYKLDGKKLILVLALAVPIVSVVLYIQLGAKKDWDIYQLINQLPESKSREEHDGKMRELIIDVQARLNQTPDNLQLQNLLAQLSMALQDYDQAESAYRAILKEYPESAGVIANLAQAMFYRAGNTVTPEVREYVEKALALAPMLPEMHGLAGIDAKNQGDLRGAIKHWKLAVQSMNKDSPVAQGYLSGIANAEAALAAAGESADAPKDPQAATEELAQIEVSVSLGADVKANPGDTLFVYARAWQGAKVPLAIKKLSVADLPLSLTLDESMAMAPGMTIKSFPELELIARISRSGSPAAQSGDWQASAGPIKLSELKGPIELVIADQVP